MSGNRGYTVEDLLRSMNASSMEKTASEKKNAPIEKTAQMDKIAETVEIYNLGRTFGIGFADGMKDQMDKLAAELLPGQDVINQAAVPPAIAPAMAAPGTVDAEHPSLNPVSQGLDSQAIAPQQIATQSLAQATAPASQGVVALKSMTPSQIVEYVSGMSKEQLLQFTADPEIANIVEGAMKQIVGVPNPAVSNAVAGN